MGTTLRRSDRGRRRSRGRGCGPSRPGRRRHRGRSRQAGADRRLGRCSGRPRSAGRSRSGAWSRPRRGPGRATRSRSRSAGAHRPRGRYACALTGCPPALRADVAGRYRSACPRAPPDESRPARERPSARAATRGTAAECVGPTATAYGISRDCRAGDITARTGGRSGPGCPRELRRRGAGRGCRCQVEAWGSSKRAHP